MSASFDAAVVGSGPNGLCAAIVLAQTGRSVVVYEAHERVGGGARTAELTLPGFQHDVCSSIHPMAVGTPLIPSLDLHRHGLRWVHPEVPLAHPLDDGPAVLLERDLHQTDLHLGPDAGRWSAWLEPFVRRWPALVADAVGPLRAPRSPLLMARFGLDAGRSASSVAGCRFDGERAKALFAGLAAHSLLRLDQPASAAFGMMLGCAGHAVGWPMPEGGAQALSDALAAHFRALGGTIRTSSPITDLRAVETGGPILLEIGPHALARLGEGWLPAAYLRRLRAFRYGLGAYKLDWALSEPIPWRDRSVARAGTVHLGGTLSAIAASEASAWAGAWCDDPFVLLGQNSLFDPSRAPAGKHTAWAYLHVAPGDLRDRTALIEAQVERYAPGFRDTILARHVLTPAGLEAYNPNYVGGDINGGVPDLWQLFARPVARLSQHTTPHPRLFLCSASTPPGGGVHGMCGWYAAQAAIS